MNAAAGFRGSVGRKEVGIEGCRALEVDSHNVFVTKAYLRSFQGVLFVYLALICGLWLMSLVVAYALSALAPSPLIRDRA